MNIKEKWVSWEEFNLLFPGLSPISPDDFHSVGGLTPGSIPFGDATGFLTEDNSNFFWDEAEKNLGIGTNVFGADMERGIQIATGEYPTADVADTFAFYSKDFAADNACPHFRTEAGTEIGLNQSLFTTDDVVFDDITVSNPVNIYALSHDAFADYAVAQHRVWEDTIAQDIHADNISEGSVTQHVGAIDHDALLNTHANPYKLDDLAAPDDNTDLDFSTAKHGLVPKGTDVGNFLKDDGTWAAGGGGESNTASNQGSGVSIYFQKAGVDLQFNAIKSENNRLAVALDGITHDVELTLVEGNIDHDALANTHANPYKLDDLAAPDDNTDLDFSTAKHGLVPKGTDVGNFLKDDGTWAAGGGGESNTASNQGSGVSIYFQKAGVDLQFNAIKSENNRLAVALDGATHDVELTLVEGNIDHDALANTHANPYKLDDLAAPDDNTDLDFSTTKHGLAPKGTDVGDYLKDDGTWDTPAGGGAIDYLDNFEDASIHWSWRTHNLDANRTIVEAANKLTIAIAGGTNGNWWSTLNNAPKIFTGVGRPPCEIITKLITVTTNNETRCGIFVSSNPIAFGVDYAMLLTRSTVGGVEGLQVQRSGTGYTTYGGAPFTNLPIWLKIRITADIRYGNHLRFYYSTDGINWTEMADPAGGYSDLLTSDGFVVGLYAENWSVFNAVSAEFDFFKVVPSLGADG